MPSRIRSKREQRDALIRQLRAEGRSWAQIAARIHAGEHVNKRVAMRLAHGWTQWEVARRWNERWPADGGGAGVTGQVISYWETWPQSGREPSVKTLCRLALIYECDVTDLIDKENYTGPDDLRHAASEPSGAAVASGLARWSDDDTDIDVSDAHRGIVGAPVAERPANVPVLVPTGFTYRWRTEPGLGGSATEREVLMAAHEGSEHAENAEQRDIGDVTLEQIRADVIRLSHDYMTGEPFGLFREMRRVRNRMYAALDRRLWPRDQTDLYFLLGCLNCLMAVAANDLGYPSAVEELARAGEAYATMIGHRPLVARLRLELANAAFWQRPRRSRELAASALEFLADGPSAAYIYLKLGRAAARLGDAPAARSAIVAASDARERGHQDELLEIGGEFNLSRATQHYLAGSTVIEIPDAQAEAISELEHAAELYAAAPEPGEDHSRHAEMIARTDLTTAQLRAGQLDAAASAVAPVLSLPSGQRISDLPLRFGRVRAELASPRYQSSAEAQDLDERIEAFLSDTVADERPLAP
jgi:hypothetical protein